MDDIAYKLTGQLCSPSNASPKKNADLVPPFIKATPKRADLPVFLGVFMSVFRRLS